MRIAIIGSGIAGLGCAWLLSRQHEVVLFEKESRLGGHTHTHDVERFGQHYRIDTGFIVHNRQHYPRSEEHTSELQSLMRISYAVFCLKKKKKQTQSNTYPKY